MAPWQGEGGSRKSLRMVSALETRGKASG